MTDAAESPRPPLEQDWTAAVGALTGARSVVLACHVTPDGDALGSMLGLALALRRRGVAVIPSFSEPFVVPDSLQVVPGRDLLVPPDQVPVEPDVLVTLDTGSVDRLGMLADRVAAAGEVIVIDHHRTNTGYGSLHLVDVTAAATAVLIADLVERLGVPLDAEIAACLYVGLSSDTGSFRHAGTTPEVHLLAARLLATGIRPDVISRSLFDSHPAQWLAMLADTIGRARVEPAEVDGLGLVWTSVLLADLLDRGLGLDQAESVIDVVRTVREAEVAVVCKELSDGSWAVSTRSAGRVDVGAVCVGLGGGGHRFAAGYTGHGPIDKVVDELRTALRHAPHLPG